MAQNYYEQDFTNWCWKWLFDEEEEKFEPAYAYLYSVKPEKEAVTIVSNKPIPFNVIGTIKGIKRPNPEIIKIINTGIYEVTFYNNDNKNTFQLKLNDDLIPGTKYEITPDSSIELVQAIIKVDLPNSILKVITLSGTTFKVGYPSIVNTSILIKKIDEL